MTDSCQYGHLRLILTKNNNYEFGQQYLMVTPLGFGVVKLIDIDFRDNHIYIVHVSGRRLCLLSDFLNHFILSTMLKALISVKCPI